MKGRSVKDEIKANSGEHDWCSKEGKDGKCYCKKCSHANWDTLKKRPLDHHTRIPAALTFFESVIGKPIFSDVKLSKEYRLNEYSQKNKVFPIFEEDL